MAKYQILVSSSAEKDMKSIDRMHLRRVDLAIIGLQNDPYPSGVKRLIAKDIAQYRIRVGDYRVLYDVDESRKKVLILRVGHRKDVYR